MEHNNKIMHDERDVEIKTKAEGYAAHIMVTVTEIALVISLLKGSDASWGFFAILMSGIATMLLYKYTKDRDKESKPYLYMSLIFGILAVGAMIKFALISFF